MEPNGQGELAGRIRLPSSGKRAIRGSAARCARRESTPPGRGRRPVSRSRPGRYQASVGAVGQSSRRGKVGNDPGVRGVGLGKVGGGVGESVAYGEISISNVVMGRQGIGYNYGEPTRTQKFSTLFRHRQAGLTVPPASSTYATAEQTLSARCSGAVLFTAILLHGLPPLLRGIRWRFRSRPDRLLI